MKFTCNNFKTNLKELKWDNKNIWRRILLSNVSFLKGIIENFNSTYRLPKYGFLKRNSWFKNEK